MPAFSIIIPVYNVEKYIVQCIESVLNQTFTDFELLVVDDCGQDRSMDVVKKYALKDKRIKILKHFKNKGLAAARNTALDKASGRYIVCLDSDDWMDLNCLSVIYSEFQLRKTASIWFNARAFYENTQQFKKDDMYNQKEGYRTLTPDNIAAFADFSWIKAYTRESIQKYNLHWPVGLTFEDGEFYFKYFTLNPKTYVISDCLINYRYREGSIVREADRGNVKMQDIYDVVIHLRDFWKRIGVYDRYKKTLLKLIQNRIRMCKNLSYTKTHIEQSKLFLKKLGYPEEFKNLKSSETDSCPLVSIVLPIYNVEKYIRQCLESIINQSYKNIEILCVDDCGQDDSMKIVEQIAESDNRIKIIKHKRNKGLGGARNTGLKYATGEYIFFFDSDDWIEENCVSTAVKKITELNLNVVFFKADVFYENVQKRSEIWYKQYAEYPEGPVYMDSDKICSIPCHTWNKCFRRKFLTDNKIQWVEKLKYEDIDVSFKIFTKSPETYMIDEVLYVYRIRDDSIINLCYKEQKGAEDLYLAIQRTYDYLKESNYMEKYKQAFLELVMINLNNYRNVPDTHEKMIPHMLKCLKHINFPNEYKSEVAKNA